MKTIITTTLLPVAIVIILYTSLLSANKALSNYDFDEHSSYSKKIADEMRPCLYERREAIYEAIQNAYEFDEDTKP